MKLGYLLSRFPLLSETFILREMWEMERQGQELRVYPLRRVRRGPRHGRVETLRAEVWWAPWLGLECQLRWLRRRPWTYLKTWAAVLWHNRGDFNLWWGAAVYWPKAAAMAERMEADGVDHIHAHYATHPAMAAYVAHRLTGIPYSFTVHAHDLYCHGAMLPQKLAAARCAVAISRLNRERLRRFAAAPPVAAPPVHVIHCGVEWAGYGDMAAKRTAARAAAPLRILAVGSLQEYKGHRHLIEACAALRGRGAVAFDCRIIGGGVLAGRLRRQIAGLGLDEDGARVELLGPQTEEGVRAALEWAEAFALPSVVDARTGQMEGIPVALMEAMAAGLAVVASRLSGIPELVEDGREGLLAEPGDAAALARALTRLADPELRRRLGERARRKIAAEFDLADNVRRLAQVLGAVPEARCVDLREMAA